MGLLDDLLGSLANQGGIGQPVNPRQQPQAPSGTSQIMMALLPVVLAMLSNRGGQGAQAGARPSTGSAGGGLGDLIGAILGGRSGATGGGGLGDLLSQLQRAGYGEQAQSWVGRGQNMPLPPDAMEQVFGRDGVAQIARRVGISEADASRGLSQLLPEVVDHVTPEGRVPNFDALTASVDALTLRSGR